MNHNGFLNIDKPLAMTSHDVVARVRRLVGRKVKVGHAGTLDPAASGVLPVAIGHATRLIEYMAEVRKGYQGLVQLGQTTTTDDAEGEVLTTAPVPAYTPAQIETVLAALRGTIMQVPPMYSALHHEGQRLYDLARAGKVLDLPARPVEIDALSAEQVAHDQLLITVTCGKGTYIRALARDIGAALGCGAHLASLRRTFVGAFSLESAIPLADLNPEDVATHLIPARIALADWPLAQLDAEQVRRVGHGMPVDLGDLAGTYARAEDQEGTLVAVLRREGDVWQPEKVLGHL